jgi:hypothetical protein
MTVRNDAGDLRLSTKPGNRVLVDRSLDVGGHLPGRNDLFGLNVYNKSRKDWSHLGADPTSPPNEGISNFIRGNTRIDGDLQVRGVVEGLVIRGHGHKWNIEVNQDGKLVFNKDGQASVIMSQPGNTDRNVEWWPK